MESSPHDSLDDLVEPLSLAAEAGDLTPARFVGVVATLEGWKATHNPHILPEQRSQRESHLKQWSETAKQFFLYLPSTKWQCYLAVGDFELHAHRLLPCQDGYGLFDSLVIPRWQVYILDYADMLIVPQESAVYDLPDPQNSDLRQLYVGDAKKGVAMSFHQFSSTLLENGIIRLLPKSV